MFARGYSVNGSTVTGYSYEPVLKEQKQMELRVNRLEHRITCAGKINELLMAWMYNGFIGLGILGILLIAVSACYLVGIYLGLLA